METRFHNLFARPNYTGYSFFVEHISKGGILRLMYLDGIISEKAELAYNGEWYNYNNFGGLTIDDFWYDSAELIPDEDVEEIINSREYQMVQHSNHIDVYAKAIDHHIM